MNIYKLKYSDRQSGINDLTSKGILLNEGYGEGIHAVVEIGKIILEQGTYDENLNEITPPVIAEGYHYDVMCEQEIDFGSNNITVNNPKHTFAGY
jgi:hypothetical protein